MGDILRYLNEEKRDIKDCPVCPSMLAEMINLIEDGTISGKIAKDVFEEMWRSRRPPKEIIEEKGLLQITDVDVLTKVINEVLEADPEKVRQYRGGKKKLFGHFMGQVMKATKGKANPRLVSKILMKMLGDEF
jgi:aspartyl-tRNA(Asn)/glutamyl-tRNA(Gln) amidotransferase subunit B